MLKVHVTDAGHLFKGRVISEGIFNFNLVTYSRNSNQITVPQLFTFGSKDEGHRFGSVF